MTMELLPTQSALECESPFNSFEKALGSIPAHIKTFSHAMRLRYVENALENDPESSRQFLELRQGTKSDALVYIEGILPISEALVTDIDRLFGQFKTLEIYELVPQLQGILDELGHCRKLCDMAKTLHEELMVALKGREDDAVKVTAQLRELEKEYKKKQSEYERLAALKRKLAIGFAFVPGVNLIVAPAFLAASNSDKKDTQLQQLQAKSKDDAATALCESFQPGLAAFVEALGEMGGFFSVLEGEIVKCHDNTKTSINEGVLNYIHKLLKKSSSDITEICREFRRVLPSVKADFKYICPDDDSDSTEVDHEYVFNKFTSMIRMAQRLGRQHCGIIDHLKEQIRRQRELAYPGARIRSKETYKFYVDED